MSATPIHQNSVTTTNGVLATWVAQPQSTPAETRDNLQYQEVFKGPYSIGRSILNIIKVGDYIEDAHTALASSVSGGTNILFDIPPRPTREVGEETITYRWVVAGIECKQIDPAGDHCLLTIKYQADYATDSVDPLTDDPYQDTWSVSWQSYTVSPWAFCSNISAQNDPVGSESDEYRYLAYRSTIEKSISQGTADKQIFDNFGGVGEQKYMLNDAEKLILKKVQTNTNAVYHYPVVVHNTVKRGKFGDAAWSEQLGEDLDALTATLPNECPYSFDAHGEQNPWKWMKIGDDIQQVHTKEQTSYTRREMWRGMKDADINYYGSTPFSHTNALLSCRWEIGKL